MSVQTDPIPPVPEHTPPLKEDEVSGSPNKKFNQTWSRWFVSLRDKVNVINSSLANLGNVSGDGIVTKNGSSWGTREIKGTPGQIAVANGTGASGDPTIGFYGGVGDLVQGANVTLTGPLTGRLVGAGDVTITASGGGGGGGGLFPNPPPTTGWTDFNLGTSVTSYTTDYQYITGELTGSYNTRGRFRTEPTPPYAVVIYLANNGIGANFNSVVAGWRLSSSTASVYTGLVHNASWRLVVTRANSDTSWNNNPVLVNALTVGGIWIKLRVDAGNRFVDVSADGIQFVNLFSENHTNFITPDQIFFGLVSQNTTYPAAVCLHNWIEII